MNFAKIIHINLAVVLVTASLAVSPYSAGASDRKACSRAHKVLFNAQSEILQTKRDLSEVRREFDQSYSVLQRWRKKADKFKCDQRGANHGKCARAEGKIRQASTDVRRAQSQEDSVLREQRKLRRQLKKAERQERRACPNELPPPQAARHTPSDARKARKAAAALGIAIGIAGILGSTRRRGGNSNCRANPLASNC